MAVVNSADEAEVLRCLYIIYGPENVQWGRWDSRTPLCEIFPPEPADANVHIGFHDLFIEGEYLTVRSK